MRSFGFKNEIKIHHISICGFFFIHYIKSSLRNVSLTSCVVRLIDEIHNNIVFGKKKKKRF